MEILMVKVPDGTKDKLRKLGNMSAVVRDQIDLVLEKSNTGSVHDRAKRLCGIIKGGPGNMATSKDYLKRYGQHKRAA
jgi:hypothetical protein